MRRSGRGPWRLEWAGIVAIWLACGGVFPGQDIGKGFGGKGFRHVLEHHTNGTPKTVLSAGRLDGKGDPDGGTGSARTIDAGNIRVECFEPGGRPEAQLTAERCRWDEAKGLVSSDGNIRLEKGGTRVTGKGFEWNITQQVVRVLSEVTVVIPLPASTAAGEPEKDPVQGKGVQR